MEQYSVSGMSCAACSARVEKAVSKVPGVTSVAVSLLTNSMGVEGSAAPEAIISAVEAAGYGAARKSDRRHAANSGTGAEYGTDSGAEYGTDSGAGYSADSGAGVSQSLSDAEEALRDRDTPILKRRLTASLGFLLLLLYVSMGHGMFGWPLPAFLNGNPVAMGLTQLLLAAVVMVINQKFFISGWKSLRHFAPNMDTLVAMGSAAAFVYSLYALFAMTGAQLRGGTAAAEVWTGEFYFESAAMILTLITVGKMLEARSKGRTTDALKSLMKLSPKTAVVIRDGAEMTVPIEQVRAGDLFAVRPGETIPVDGVVEEGESAVNEAALTGESIPVDKAPGDSVSAATLNQSGFLRCRATRVGEDTTLSQIIRMVSDAAATKAPIARIADQVSGVFVPAVIAIALVAAVVWLCLGQSAGFALARGISVLVISCPCALGLATPVAIMVGNGVGAKNGILCKTAVSLEEAGKMEIIALDKTGTITSGEPNVTDLLPQEHITEWKKGAETGGAALLSFAAALEQKSEHPLAQAVLREAEKQNIAIPEVTAFQALPGNGLTAILQGGASDGGGTDRRRGVLCGGSLAFISTKAEIPDKARRSAERLSEEGKIPLFFTLDGRLLGLIAVADTIKADSPAAIRELRDLGVRVVMLTGDNERTARAIGRQAGVDEVIAGVLPDGKESAIRALQEQGKTAMVGDGINDAPALARADLGIAIGAGTDVAMDAADVVLMKSALTDVPAAIRLSRAVLRNIRQNLFWAFFYNTVGIPLAAGALIPFGLTLHPMFGAAAMSLSSFCVVSNALRLNLLNVYDSGRDRPLRKNRSRDKQRDKYKEEKKMVKILKIEGMMCAHCEARVKKALEALEEVESAAVSHATGDAVVNLKAPAEDAVLRKAVEDQDYKVLEIR